MGLSAYFRKVGEPLFVPNSCEILLSIGFFQTFGSFRILGAFEV